jgi:ATPase subunit of ABC transporter with duplicated ATPase domains
MRVALARILLMQPDAMLLDEPSNHLDLESLIWLEEFLKGYDGMLMMTSHDREFMNRIVTKIVEIDSGELTTYSGDYEFYEQQRALNERQQQAAFERQRSMLAKEIKFIERFKARASHAAQVQSRVKKLEKIDRVEPPRRRQTVLFEFPQAPRSGEDVAILKNVSKRYGSRSIYEGLDFQVRRKERWCVMGINGAGKSTLLKLVTGSTEPDEGQVSLGGSVKMGYFAQHAMELLEGEHTVFESLESAFPQAGQGSLRALAGCFGAGLAFLKLSGQRLDACFNAFEARFGGAGGFRQRGRLTLQGLQTGFERRSLFAQGVEIGRRGGFDARLGGPLVRFGGGQGFLDCSNPAVDIRRCADRLFEQGDPVAERAERLRSD